MKDTKDIPFDPKVNSVEVHIADVHRHISAAGQIVRAAAETTGVEGDRLKRALKTRLEAAQKSVEAALACTDKKTS